MKKILAQLASDANAIWGAIVGEAADPKRHATTPVAFWHKMVPVADVPKKNTSNAIELDTTLYTEEEIMSMSDQEFAQKIGCLGLETREEAIGRMGKKKRKNNEIEF